MLFRFQIQSVAYVERTYLFSRNKKPFLPTKLLVIVSVVRVNYRWKWSDWPVSLIRMIIIIVRVLFFACVGTAEWVPITVLNVWGIWNCAHRNPCDWILTMRAYNPTRKLSIPKFRIPFSKYVILSGQHSNLAGHATTPMFGSCQRLSRERTLT